MPVPFRHILCAGHRLAPRVLRNLAQQNEWLINATKIVRLPRLLAIKAVRVPNLRR